MEIRLYSIYDRLAEEYGPLFMQLNDEVARRQYYASLAKMDDTLVDDYALYYLGEYDTSTGRIVQASGSSDSDTPYRRLVSIGVDYLIWKKSKGGR